MEEYVMILDDIKDRIDQLIKLEQESTFTISDLEIWIWYLEQQILKTEKFEYFDCPCKLGAIRPYMEECPIAQKIHIAYKYSSFDDLEEFTEIENVCANICDRTDPFRLIELFVISDDIPKDNKKEAVKYLVKKLTQLLNTIKNKNLIPIEQ